MADWTRAEQYYDQGTTAGYILSLLESERVLRRTAELKKFPGRDGEERTAHALAYVSSAQQLAQTRRLVAQMMALNMPQNMTQQAAEQALRTYFTAVSEIENVPSSSVLKDQLRYRAGKIKKTLIRALLSAAIAAVLLVGGAVAVADTAAGRIAAAKLLEVSRVIAYKALPITLLVILVLMILVGVALSRQKQVVIKSEDLKEETN